MKGDHHQWFFQKRQPLSCRVCVNKNSYDIPGNQGNTCCEEFESLRLLVLGVDVITPPKVFKL